MISPASSVAAMAAVYSGGTPPAPQPGFGATLAAKLAELQTISLGLALLHHHRHGNLRGTGIINQDAGNQNKGRLVGLEPGTIAG